MYLLYGDLFAHQDNDSKAMQQYELAVRNINSYHSFSQISQLANGLQIRSKIDLDKDSDNIINNEILKENISKELNKSKKKKKNKEKKKKKNNENNNKKNKKKEN